MSRTVTVKKWVKHKIDREERIVNEDGSWVLIGYDKVNRPIYYENSDKYSEFILIDKSSEIVYYRNSLGHIRDHRFTEERIEKAKEREARLADKRKATTKLHKERYKILREVGFSTAEANELKKSGKKRFKQILQEKAKQRLQLKLKGSK